MILKPRETVGLLSFTLLLLAKLSLALGSSHLGLGCFEVCYQSARALVLAQRIPVCELVPIWLSVQSQRRLTEGLALLVIAQVGGGLVEEGLRKGLVVVDVVRLVKFMVLVGSSEQIIFFERLLHVRVTALKQA